MSDNPLAAWWMNALNYVGNQDQPQRDNPLASMIASNPVGTSVVAPQLTNATPIDTRSVVQRRLADAMPMASTMVLGMTGGESPFDSVPSGARAAPTSNYVGSLGQYAKNIFREMTPDEALNHLGAIQTDMTGNRLYMADHPKLATGQGDNSGGVMLSFDADKLQGRVNTSKPIWQPAYEGGMGEYIASHNGQEDYKGAVNGIRIPTNVKMRGYEKRLWQKTVGDLEKTQGWVKTSGKGYTEYTRPDGQ